MREVAIFAGGCFWCMVQPFDQHPGIYSVESGYTGGHKKTPTYQEVCAGGTGHTEAVKIEFDATVISYDELLTIYWQQTDPTDAFGQFQDRGESYRPVIFYQNDEQKKIAERSKQVLSEMGKYDTPIVTTIEAACPFYIAEGYHQDYYKKKPDSFKLSHQLRADFLSNVWGDEHHEA